MNICEDKFLLILESFNQAMLLYNELLNKRCKVELVSTPCWLSKGCSQSIVFYLDDTRLLIEEIKKNKIAVMGIYKIVLRDHRFDYIPIKNI